MCSAVAAPQKMDGDKGEGLEGEVAADAASGAGSQLSAAAIAIEARRKEQSKCKHSAGTWLAAQGTTVLGVFITLRLALRPLAGIMLDHLRVASDEWDIEQDRRGVDASAAGGCDAGHRDYHAVLACENKFESVFMETAIGVMKDIDKVWD